MADRCGDCHLMVSPGRCGWRHRAHCPKEGPMSRFDYLTVLQGWRLDQACMPLWDVAEFHGTYHVGSSLLRKDWRDVDVRTLVDDDIYDAHSPDLWRLLQLGVSSLLSEQSGLPVDWQPMPQREFREHDGEPRNAMGMRPHVETLGGASRHPGE